MTKRRATIATVIASLLLGALLNIAVAWWCCPPTIKPARAPATPAAAARPSDGIPYVDFYGYMEARGLQLRTPGEWPAETPATEHWPVRPGVEVWGRASGYDNSTAASEGFVMEVQHAGWPARSLISERRGSEQGSKTTGLYDQQSWMRFFNRSDLPITPIWPGFAINTIFWSLPALTPVALWIGFKHSRATNRLRRGLCPHCAYDRTGLPPETPCPECGKPRT